MNKLQELTAQIQALKANNHCHFCIRQEDIAIMEELLTLLQDLEHRLEQAEKWYKNYEKKN